MGEHERNGMSRPETNKPAWKRCLRLESTGNRLRHPKCDFPSGAQARCPEIKNDETI